MTRRYINIAEAAEYLNVSERTVRRLIADGELTGYRAGKSHRLIRVDLDEIDSKLMQPIGLHWNDPAATHRRRDTPRVPDRSAAVKRVETAAAVANAIRRKPRPPKRYCTCGHTDAAHGLRTTVAPRTMNPPKIGVCWTCGCPAFDETAEPRKRKQ